MKVGALAATGADAPPVHTIREVAFADTGADHVDVVPSTISRTWKTYVAPLTRRVIENEPWVRLRTTRDPVRPTRL